MNKYPYIPKEYYPAVMFACKMIRENGYFNKAIKTASDYYDVDADKVEAYVRKRQGAGQKGKTRKYKYYVVYGAMDCMCDDDCGTCHSWSYTDEDWKLNARRYVVRATSLDNAKKSVHAEHDSNNYFGRFVKIIKTFEFESKKDAEDYRITEEEFMEAIHDR